MRIKINNEATFVRRRVLVAFWVPVTVLAAIYALTNLANAL